MRNLLIVFVIMLAPLFSNGQTFNFEKDGNRRGWNFGGGTVEVEDGVYLFNMDGSVKTPNIRKSKINADKASYMHVVLKNNTNAVEMIKFNFKNDDGKTEFIFKEISNNDKEFVTYTFDLKSKSNWTGIKHPNLRFTNSKDLIKGTIVIDEIVFNSTNTHKK
jgi:hypothetical protein